MWAKLSGMLAPNPKLIQGRRRLRRWQPLLQRQVSSNPSRRITEWNDAFGHLDGLPTWYISAVRPLVMAWPTRPSHPSKAEILRTEEILNEGAFAQGLYIGLMRVADMIYILLLRPSSCNRMLPQYSKCCLHLESTWTTLYNIHGSAEATNLARYCVWLSGGSAWRDRWWKSKCRSGHILIGLPSGLIGEGCF